MEGAQKARLASSSGFRYGFAIEDTIGNAEELRIRAALQEME